MAKVKIIGEVTGVEKEKGKIFTRLTFPHPQYPDSLSLRSQIIVEGEFPLGASVITEMDIFEEGFDIPNKKWGGLM